MIDDTDQRYYTHLAAAFVRGKLGLRDDGTDDEAVFRQGLDAGLKLHKFKRSSLPRVARVLGVLRGLAPEAVLDVGSGRGAFLWPLLDAFPELPVTSIEVSAQRVADLMAVASGGISTLTALQADVRALDFPDGAFDVTTALEVLEHLEDPTRACRQCVRVSRRYLIVSVPSQPDDNPGHVQLFSASSLTQLLQTSGAHAVKTEFVLGHIIAVAKVSP